ncbi:hypothetical protein D3C72_983990 [compost metagenome]
MTSLCCAAGKRTHFCAGSARHNLRERTQICVDRRRNASACRSSTTIPLPSSKSQCSLSTYTWLRRDIHAVPVSAPCRSSALRPDTYTSPVSWAPVPVSASTLMLSVPGAIEERTHFCVPIAGMGRIRREIAAYQILRGQLDAKSGLGRPMTVGWCLKRREGADELRTRFCVRMREARAAIRRRPYPFLRRSVRKAYPFLRRDCAGYEGRTTSKRSRTTRKPDPTKNRRKKPRQ